jgi:hypothetical protein
MCTLPSAASSDDLNSTMLSACGRASRRLGPRFDALTASIGVVVGPRESYTPSDSLRKDSLIVVERHVELPGTLTEKPSLPPVVLTLIYPGSEVGDPDRFPIVIVRRDGGVLEIRVAFIARLSGVSEWIQNKVGHFMQSPGQRGCECKLEHTRPGGRWRPEATKSS